ncbi:hypothetical protein B0H10DRAFT_1954194 [Mycena sp. CBHHK59/15]|nr:hypothetical protein B0H10DRAFT_1954194 [Mycena sp. CBHHK59/15]
MARPYVMVQDVVVIERLGALDAGLTKQRPTHIRAWIDLIAAESSTLQSQIPPPIELLVNTSILNVRAPSDADWLGKGVASILLADGQIVCERLGALDPGLTEQRPTHIRAWIDLIAAESQGSLVFDLPVSAPSDADWLGNGLAPSILQASDLNRSLNYTYTYIERLDAFGRGSTQYRPSPNHFHFFIVSPGCGTCVVSACFSTVSAR